MNRSLRLWPTVLLVLLITRGPTLHAQERRVSSADIDFLLSSIREIHPNPYRLFSASRFDSVAASLKAQLGSWPAHRAALETQRLLAMVKDGHTEWERLPVPLRGQWLPLIVRRFEEGWFVRTGDPAYRRLFGKPILRLAGMKIDDVVQRILPYVSGENEIGKLDGVGDYMRNVRILDALGIVTASSAEVTVTVKERNGSETRVPVTATGDSWVRDHWIDVEELLNAGAAEPLHLRLDGNYACAWLPDDRTVYVLFSEVRDDGDETIADFFGRMYDFARQVDPDKLVLDLRENSGGNLYLNGPVLRGLIASPRLDRAGRFFVIIGSDTYSAAMNLAVLLERFTHVLFVGSPTGASPNHFGDTRVVELPGSGIRVEISELYWQNSDPRDTRPWITPDLVVDPSVAALIAGRDPVLDTILQFRPSADLAETFGSPMARWQRASQAQASRWPALLEPAARTVDWSPGPQESRSDPCVVR